MCSGCATTPGVSITFLFLLLHLGVGSFKEGFSKFLYLAYRTSRLDVARTGFRAMGWSRPPPLWHCLPPSASWLSSFSNLGSPTHAMCLARREEQQEQGQCLLAVITDTQLAKPLPVENISQRQMLGKEWDNFWIEKIGSLSESDPLQTRKERGQGLRGLGQRTTQCFRSSTEAPGKCVPCLVFPLQLCR